MNQKQTSEYLDRNTARFVEEYKTPFDKLLNNNF